MKTQFTCPAGRRARLMSARYIEKRLLAQSSPGCRNNIGRLAAGRKPHVRAYLTCKGCVVRQVSAQDVARQSSLQAPG